MSSGKKAVTFALRSTSITLAQENREATDPRGGCAMHLLYSKDLIQCEPTVEPLGDYQQNRNEKRHHASYVDRWWQIR